MRKRSAGSSFDIIFYNKEKYQGVTNFNLVTHLSLRNLHFTSPNIVASQLYSCLSIIFVASKPILLPPNIHSVSKPTLSFHLHWCPSSYIGTSWLMLVPLNLHCCLLIYTVPPKLQSASQSTKCLPIYTVPPNLHRCLTTYLT